jgi:hypothetical protein
MSRQLLQTLREAHVAGLIEARVPHAVELKDVTLQCDPSRGTIKTTVDVDESHQLTVSGPIARVTLCPPDPDSVLPTNWSLRLQLQIGPRTLMAVQLSAADWVATFTFLTRTFQSKLDKHRAATASSIRRSTPPKRKTATPEPKQTKKGAAPRVAPASPAKKKSRSSTQAPAPQQAKEAEEEEKKTLGRREGATSDQSATSGQSATSTHQQQSAQLYVREMLLAKAGPPQPVATTGRN